MFGNYEVLLLHGIIYFSIIIYGFIYIITSTIKDSKVIKRLKKRRKNSK